MAITAAKIGSSMLTLDWANLATVSPGAHVDAEDAQAAWKRLESRFQSNEVGFFHAPKKDEISQAEASKKLADEILSSRRFTDVLFLGIGGSALGPIAMLSALEQKRDAQLRFHFLENPDPIDWKLAQNKLNPDSTLVCAVTKSGGTFETMAQFMLALEWLGHSRWSTHVVALTDPEKGDLRKFATQQKIPTLTIAPSIGGRFSIFSPVGLFPAALAGLSIDQFLAGAAAVHDYVIKTPLEKNPIAILGSSFISHFSKRPIHVCMPYSTRLRLIGDWWVQLWGESLGKDGKGFTPIAAVGAIDQHSILQLLRDGPDDKITAFITVDKVDQPVTIPKIELKATELPSSFALLQGHTLHQLLQTEYRATALVLTRRNRPHFSIQMDELSERSVGALLFLFSTLTALTGELWGVNPFDQPGVEEGKVYTREFLTAQRAEKADISDSHSAVNRLRRES